MAVEVIIDQITTLSAKEMHGVLVELRREALVTGVDDGDYEAIFTALDQLGIEARSSLTGHDYLLLAERNPAVDPRDNTVFHVELVYEHFNSPFQDLDDPAHGMGPMIRSRSSLQQFTTSVDGDHDPITVQYTYPADDPDYPSEIKIQGKEVSVTEPIDAIIVEGLGRTNRPEDIKAKMINHLNATEFLGHPWRSVLCTAVDYEQFGLSGGGQPGLVHFRFEFQYCGRKPITDQVIGWDPIVRFIDDRTGMPPSDLVGGTGLKMVFWYEECEFKNYIDLLG